MGDGRRIAVARRILPACGGLGAQALDVDADGSGRHMSLHYTIPLARWEAGEFKPSLSAMVAIARALDIPAVELMAAAAVDVP